MARPIVGIAVHEPTPKDTLETIIRADQLGVPAVWLTTGGAGPDGPTLLAAAAARTERILMGTSIVPTFPRHPLVMVQQAIVLGSLAPGRFRLGIGPSHRAPIENTYGIPFERPLEHLREYVEILRQALSTGKVDFDGHRLRAHARPPITVEVPVMISALRAHSYELAGEIADGAIAWISPAPFLRDVAIPALQTGAARAGRPAPPLIAHAFAVVSEDTAAVLEIARRQLAGYPRMPFYQEMFAAAGHPEARQGTWSQAMLDAVVLHGDEAAVARGLRAFLDAGAAEVIASLLAVGPDRRASLERTMRLIASL
ncbi:MAG: LLM class flavin-dependent oxidoreductase [Chloroflexi bacterium]|nr:LLM class flavin-dependent oxidoreductase [Chloroflexota bacterium]